MPHAIIYAGLSLTVWNMVLSFRSRLGRQNWVLLLSQEKFYFRMFSPLGKTAASEPNVIAFDAGEVRSVHIQTRTIFIHGPKPKVIEWLVVEPAPAAQTLTTFQFNRLSPPIGTCDPHRIWFARSKDGNIIIPWQSYRPALRVFAKQIELRFPKLTKREVTLPELDLISAVNAREPERKRRLAEAKRLGFGADCIRALWMNPTGSSLYRRRSLKESAEYMRKIEIE